MILLGLIVVVPVVIGVVVWRLGFRGRMVAPATEFRRAGVDESVSQGDAFRRASGENAWMLPSGGGL
ncbi:hypothetical protein AB0M43_13260 [Longispora sp. NPDC051575]|uniref:hypothetical protein n=1 Tax=Longispora sp. NPDC051575 TaxID=3154943 RepID=UPI00343B1C55